MSRYEHPATAAVRTAVERVTAVERALADAKSALADAVAALAATATTLA